MSSVFYLRVVRVERGERVSSCGLCIRSKVVGGGGGKEG